MGAPTQHRLHRLGEVTPSWAAVCDGHSATDRASDTLWRLICPRNLASVAIVLVTHLAGVITDVEGDAASPTRCVDSRRDSE